MVRLESTKRWSLGVALGFLALAALVSATTGSALTLIPVAFVVVSFIVLLYQECTIDSKLKKYIQPRSHQIQNRGFQWTVIMTRQQPQQRSEKACNLVLERM